MSPASRSSEIERPIEASAAGPLAAPIPDCPRVVGRRPGKTETREAILVAARGQFARDGYGGTSVRAIAGEAGVDPAMINYFFGSKAGLFVEAIPWPVDPKDVVEHVVSGRREEAGRRLAEVFVVHWREWQKRCPIISLINAATADAEAAVRLRDFLLDELLMPLVNALGSDRGLLRAGLISAQLTGLGLSRYVYGILDPAESSDAEIIDAISPALQRYLTGSLD